MGLTNAELIEKAKVTTAALAAAGKLNPKQANKFIDYVVDATMLANNARVVRFRNETAHIDKIGVGRRVAMPKAEATATTVRRGVTATKIALTPKVIIVPFEISDEFAEINIEGEDVKDKIIRMMATQLGNNLEELYILGNTTGYAVLEADILEGGSAVNYINDSYLALTNGWFKLAESGNVFDADGENVSAGVFSRMLNAMPQKFKKNKRILRYLVSSEHEQLYRELMSTRIGETGEKALNTSSNLTPFGVEMVPVPLLPKNPPNVEEVVLNGTATVALEYSDVSDLTVLPQALAAVATAGYVLNIDYEVDLEAGEINRKAGGAIGDGDTVKVTYNTLGKSMLTPYNNLIVAIGRDIRIEKDRDIFAGTDMYAITVKADVNIEEVTATVLGTNIGDD